MAYVPVLHAGYRDFFNRNHGLTNNCDCYVFGTEVVELIDAELDYLRKEIRSLTPEEVTWALNALDVSYQVKVLGLADCERIARAGGEVVMADEDASRVLAKRFFAGNQVIYDPVFLRWNRDNTRVNREVEPDRTVAVTLMDQELMMLAVEEAKRSSDWWRQIGAVATTQNGQVLFASCNHHLPSPHTPYIDGDPRNTAHRGEGLDLYTSIHAEADIIAQAAGSEISLFGAYLYSSTFPCPPCAKLIARAGFCRLYCAEDYALLDGVRTLRDADIEIIKVV